MEKIDLAVLGATGPEIAPLAEYFRLSGQIALGGNVFFSCARGTLRLLIGTTGIGKVNAAAIASLVISRFEVAEIWYAGCAGAYDGSGLRIGDVLVTRDSLCGDEGVLEKETVHSMSRIGIPLLRREGIPLYDRFSLKSALRRGRLGALLPPGEYTAEGAGDGIRPCSVRDGRAGGFSLRYGAGLTVGMASGDPETASARFHRHGALAENMEGSAVAQTCALFDVPLLEIRGVSNIAGVRDREQWDIPRAIGNALSVVRYLVAHFRPDGISDAGG